MILRRVLVTVAVLMALGHSTDADRMKNNSTVLFPAFIFGLHLPLVLVLVGLVFLYHWYRKEVSMTANETAPPPTYPQDQPQAQSQVTVQAPVPAPSPKKTQAPFPGKVTRLRVPIKQKSKTHLSVRPETPNVATRVEFQAPYYWINKAGDYLEFIDITNDSEFIKTLLYPLWNPKQVGKGKDAQDLDPYKYIHIRKVVRVENAGLYQKYYGEKKKMERKEHYIQHFKGLDTVALNDVLTTEEIQSCPILEHSDLEKDIDHDINEHYLFHGTKTDSAESICRQGLRMYYVSPGLFGKGVYLAEDPTKSDQYTDSRRNDNTLFLCRACLGEIYVHKRKKGAEEFESPPCSTCFEHKCPDHQNLTFDSVVTEVPNMRFREYVVYRDYRVYPEYMITYDRKPDDSEMREYYPRY